MRPSEQYFLKASQGLTTNLVTPSWVYTDRKFAKCITIILELNPLVRVEVEL